MPAEILAVHPVLMARDVVTSLVFYEQLGFVETFRDDRAAPKYAAVRRGPVELHLQWGDPSQWHHPGDRPAYRFLVRDVDALHREFHAGADAVGRGPDRNGGPWALPADTPWGTREFHLRDPGGNVLQFYQAATAIP